MDDQNLEKKGDISSSEIKESAPIQQEQPLYQGQPSYSNNPERSQFQAQPEPMPENYMTLSIVATVVGFLTCCSSCCISGILGIIAIVFSSQVTSKYTSGDMNGAISSAKTAKILGIISLVITGIALLGSIIYYAIVISTVGAETFMEQYMEALEQMQ